MTSSIDPLRRSQPVRRARTEATESLDETDGAAEIEGVNLPIPVSRPRTIPNTPAASPAAIEAQLLGERRGLRAGATVIDQAKVTYNRTEWSGSRDRRSPKGRAAKTEI